jgi:hypothetical protein
MLWSLVWNSGILRDNLGGSVFFDRISFAMLAVFDEASSSRSDLALGTELRT